MPTFPKLAVREKILLCLASLGAERGLASTQIGIASAIHLNRSHVSRALDALLNEGLADKRRERVAGFQRTLLVCNLTPQGQQTAEAMQKDLERLVIEVRTAGGLPIQKALGEALQDRTPRTFWQAVLQLEKDGFLVAIQRAEALPKTEYAIDVDEMPVVHQFVGRTAELGQLAHWMRTVHPSCMVQGPGGIGKSSLVAQALQQHPPRRHLLWIRLEPNMKLGQFLARMDRFMIRLGRPVVASASESSEDVMQRLPGRLRGTPLLLVVDDVHKADPELHRAFNRLAEAAERGDGLQVIWIGRSLRLPVEAVLRALRLDLAPLTVAEREEALKALAVPADRWDSLAQKSGGNPLFLGLLAASDTPEEASESFVRHLTGTLASQATGPRQQLLQHLCALRIPIASSRLEQLWRDREGDLDELVQSRLVAQTRDGSLGLHDEVRDVFYARLTSQQQRRVHAAWASVFGPDPALLDDAVEYLYHLARSGRQAEAAWWSLRHQTQILEWARLKFALSRDSSASVNGV
jgi:DNA-binding MarR family transcriptional regulator